MEKQELKIPQHACGKNKKDGKIKNYDFCTIARVIIMAFKEIVYFVN